MTKLRLAIFGSGEGTTLEYLWDQAVAGLLDVDIVLAVSDRENSPFAEKARARQLACCFTRTWGVINRALAATQPDVCLLAGFMRIVPTSLLRVSTFINVHPSYLPDLPGKDPQKRAIAERVKSTGVTLHFATEQVDAGSIIVQARLPVLVQESEESLTRRLKLLSYRLLSRAFEAPEDLWKQQR